MIGIIAIKKLTKYLNISFLISFHFLILGYPIVTEATGGEGIVLSKPICIYLENPESIHCFVWGPNDRMYHNWLYGSQWSGWMDRGGNLTSVPFCLSPLPNRIDCFARGSNNQLIHGVWEQFYWRGWYDVDQQVIASSPRCAVTTSSNGYTWIHCYVKGMDNHLLRKTFTIDPDGVSYWSGWRDYGGEIYSTPEVVKSPSQHIGVFARGADDQLLYNHYFAGVWEDLNGTLGSSPDCVAMFTNTKDCFALRESPFAGVNDWMLHKQYNSNYSPFWSEWEEITVPLTSPPTCVYLRAPEILVNGDGEIHCFARGPYKHLIHMIYFYEWNSSTNNYSNHWGAWEDLGGDLRSSPHCISSGTNRIDCFARSNNNQMIHIKWDGSEWSDWEEVEGGVLPDLAVAYAINEWDGDCCTDCGDLPWMPNMTHAWLEAMPLHGWRHWWNYYGLVINTKLADPARVSWGRDNNAGSGLDSGHAAIIGIHGKSDPQLGWVGTMHTKANNSCDIGAVNMMKIGAGSGGRLRFLHLISCDSMKWEHISRWFYPAEGKVHLITGFHGNGACGEGYVNDYASVAFFGFSFGVGWLWVEQTYHVGHWYNFTDDICPISVGFGPTLEASDNALNETYDDHWDDPIPTCSTALYIGGCDPDGGDSLPE